jgi:hypothetical protein
LDWFVEILRSGWRNGAAAGENAEHRAKLTEPPKPAAGVRADHGFGCGPV